MKNTLKPHFISPFLLALFVLFAPAASWAYVALGKPNTGGSTALIVYSSDGGWDQEIAVSGSTCLLDLLTSTGAAYTAGVGFYFSVTQLPVSPTFNNCVGCYNTTAQSAIQNAVSAATIPALVNGSGNPNYCIVFDMRFLSTSNDGNVG